MNLNLRVILFTTLLVFSSVSLKLLLSNKNESESKGIKINSLDFRKIKVNSPNKWNDNYELTIEYIKKHEGFAGGKPYICPGGYKTIGYGHVIKKNEIFTQLTKQQADSLLRSDFNKALRLVEKTTDLKGSKKLAIAHFVFTRGIGTFLRSPLKKLVDEDLPIEKEILKMCYYRNRTGKLIRSQHAFNIRTWEVNMYNDRL